MSQVVKVDQKISTRLNERDFYITIQNPSSDSMLPEYYYQSCDFFVIETSATKAISKTYQNIFQNKIPGNSYKSSLIYLYKKRPAIFVSKIEDNKCHICIYQDFKLQKTFVEAIPNNVWKNSGFIQKFSGIQLFGLEDEVILQKLVKIHISQYASYEWDNFNLMKKLYEYHLQRQTSSIE
ncbi:hypothetical protein GLOIN_2v1788841 [Rhizophagus irregularis DAOM 181602=DAOM 197198]|uniref:Uncharacterized protein n=1 Tax=Rhizophagus irregularis (strain DAOM 181602 / DAOM 197198 / MUCL 43194) TaxID=747089 RepID=A0A2P4P2U0_RHIID|nr:hypothetical protein GLOIN_2v1788841 [Rhizophagus irregularis DAOM 181602=DAOM 197198]POG59706.1 hypothetical protein GLOIN_2v1788841 [Rhizophagus irregularis DAOM 181602=DAOM 197198]GET62624.1 hypothetical protein GLOIN_2v1788841 [Rhizophagus irregularis DAOM 181602=DAOM 197198]|eukprot:XP_025166572.1 hypothetical protein GLOIN_2v1788841 [Rhizophagus irregularis DAOM 181602=DAOM 197198]